VQTSPPTSDGLSGDLFSPYGLVLSGALGDASGLIDGESDGLCEGDAVGKAFAITPLILVIVAAFRYAG
jgi:hypothetical protein